MSISSDEINLLIQHYLQELGYSHAAFAFGCESQIPLKEIAKRKVQPGSLVYLIQKGIMFAHMEAAAEKALDEPSRQFALQLSQLRANLRQSTELVDELCAATRRMKVFPTPDQTEIRPFYLDNQSALFLQGHQTPAIVCAWNKTSEYMATASEAGSIIVWNFETLQNKSCIVHHASTLQRTSSKANEPKDVTALCWSNYLEQKEILLASGNFNGTISIYKRGEEVNSISYHKTPIIELQFSHDGFDLLSAASGGTVIITSIDKTSYAPAVLAHWEIKDEIVGAVWMNDKSITKKDNNSILIASLKNLYRARENENNLSLVFTSHAPIVQLVTNSQHDMFVIGDNDGSINVFNNQGSNIYSSLLHKGAVCCLSILESNPLTFATGGFDGSVHVISITPSANGNSTKLNDIINTDASAKVLNFEGHVSAVYCVAFDPIGRYIASAAKETINIWSMDTKKLHFSYIATCPVITVSWSPDGRFLTISLFSGEVAVIDFEQLC